MVAELVLSGGGGAPGHQAWALQRPPASRQRERSVWAAGRLRDRLCQLRTRRTLAQDTLAGGCPGARPALWGGTGLAGRGEGCVWLSRNGVCVLREKQEARAEAGPARGGGCLAVLSGTHGRLAASPDSVSVCVAGRSASCDFSVSAVTPGHGGPAIVRTRLIKC